MSFRIAISGGDYNGIGPEVVLKTLAKQVPGGVTPVILSSSSVVNFYRDRLQLDLDYHTASSVADLQDGKINLLECYDEVQPSPKPGHQSRETGKCAMMAVETGIQLCTERQADALVTAPISKEAVNLAGYNIPGHTEFLAEQTGTADYMMMLVNEGLRVGLVTGHIPVSSVAQQLSGESISRCIRTMQNSLSQDFGINRPKIAVLGLNPHAGDGGIIGKEELEIIIPALEVSRSDNLELDGPYPADGFFGNRTYKEYDGILAMYHDQGLIPFKTLSFGAGVNFTAGLPIIRTSPDHGTAFDIAGMNKADPSSFKQAFELAIKMAENRNVPVKQKE